MYKHPAKQNDILLRENTQFCTGYRCVSWKKPMSSGNLIWQSCCHVADGHGRRQTVCVDTAVHAIYIARLKRFPAVFMTIFLFREGKLSGLVSLSLSVFFLEYSEYWAADVCCAVGGVRHPQHTQTGSNSSTIAADSSNGVVTNTRCCRYSCMRSWW
jgi:hypothetical protein